MCEKKSFSLPNIFSLFVSSGEGKTINNAIDNAKYKIGVNFMLLQVSSILPLGIRYVEPEQFLKIVPNGAIVPTAIGINTSDKSGQLISAAIGVGIPKNPAHFGMIMEFYGYCPSREAEEKIKEMLLESFNFEERKRIGLSLKEIKVLTVEYIVRKCGCVLAICPLWQK